MAKKAKQTDKLPGAARRAGLSAKKYRKLARDCCRPDERKCDDCPLKKALKAARKRKKK
jgi:endonuclease III